MIKKLFFSQTAKDTYWVFGANLFTAFLAFIYTIFLARSFAPSDLGIFSAIYAFILLVSDVSDMGTGSSLSRFLPSYYVSKNDTQADSFIKTAFKFQLKIALIVFALVLIFSGYLSAILLKNSNFSTSFIVSGFGIVATVLMAFSTYLLSAKKKFSSVATINSISTISKLLIVLILYVSGNLNVFNVILAFSLSSLVAYIWAAKIITFGFMKQKEDKGNLKKLLSFSMFLGISKIFSAISGRLDALMLIPLSSAFEAGIYSAAFKIIYLYILLSGSFSMVIAPRLAGYGSYREALLYLRKVIMVVFGILLTLLLMYFIAPWFVVFVLGKKYIPSVDVFKALLLPIGFFVMTIPPVNFILYTLKKPQVSTFNTFIQLIIMILGNMYFIPRYGRFGPVMTLTIAYFFTFVSATSFAVYFYRRGQNGK